jgi:hypothetical protein
MSRRLQLVVALLLPLMVLRGLLPAGYMPVAERGQLRMVLCSDGLWPAGPAHPDSRSGHVASTDCPFALASLLAPPVDAAAMASVATTLPTTLSLPTAQQAPSPVPLRHDSARGPPLLS